jgi:hypothetical protein
MAHRKFTHRSSPIEIPIIDAYDVPFVPTDTFHMKKTNVWQTTGTQIVRSVRYHPVRITLIDVSTMISPVDDSSRRDARLFHSREYYPFHVNRYVSHGSTLDRNQILRNVDNCIVHITSITDIPTRIPCGSSREPDKSSPCNGHFSTLA